MPDETSQEKVKFNPSAWAQENPVMALLVTAFTTLLLSFGTNQVTNKAFAQNEKSQGMSEAAADGKYLQIAEANRRAEIRDRVQVTKELFEERTKSINDRIDLKTNAIESKVDSLTRLVEQIAENQRSNKETK